MNSSPTERLPAPVVYALVAVLIVVAGLVVYFQMRPAKTGAVTAQEKMIVRKCAKCGKVFEDPGAEILKKGYVDLEGAGLLGEGKRCPDCKEDTLVLAEKCPKDGTVFVPDTSKGYADKAACCPKCGWSPYVSKP